MGAMVQSWVTFHLQAYYFLYQDTSEYITTHSTYEKEKLCPNHHPELNGIFRPVLFSQVKLDSGSFSFWVQHNCTEACWECGFSQVPNDI